MTCPNCRNSIDNNDSVCRFCGMNVTGYAGKIKTKRKGITVFLAVLLFIVIAASGVCYYLFEMKGDTQENKKPTTSDDVSVKAVCVADSEFRIILYNNSNNIITGYTVCVVGYDKDGKAVDLDDSSDDKCLYVKNDGISVSSHCYFGGDTFMSCPQNVESAVAMVTKVDYYDKQSWSCENEDIWAKDCIDNYDKKEIEKYNTNLKKPYEEAKGFANTVGLSISNLTNDNGNLSFNAKSTLNDQLIGFEIAVSQWDDNGNRIDCGDMTYISKNIMLVNVKDGLLFNYNDLFSSENFFMSNCSSYDYIITKVYYSDGENDVNPYAVEWALYSEK